MFFIKSRLIPVGGDRDYICSRAVLKEYFYNIDCLTVNDKTISCQLEYVKLVETIMVGNYGKVSKSFIQI